MARGFVDRNEGPTQYKGKYPIILVKNGCEWPRSDGYRGMAHTYLNPDGDGDTDHLIAVNMDGSGLARSALICCRI